MPTKKTLLSKLRRKNIRLARRIRSMDDSLVNTLFNEPTQIKGHASLSFVGELRQHQTFLLPFLNKEERMLSPGQSKIINALLNLDLSKINNNKELESVFFKEVSSSKNNEPKELRDAFRLIDKMEYIKNNTTVTNQFVSLCKKELGPISNRLALLKSKARERLPVLPSHSEGYSIFTTSRSYSNSIDTTLCQYLFDLPLSQNIFLLENEISEKGLKVLDSSVDEESQSKFIRDGHIDLDDSGEESRNIYNTMPQLFIDTLCKMMSKKEKAKTPLFLVTPLDIDEISQVYALMPNPRSNSAEKFAVELNPNDPWFLKVDNSLSSTELKALPENKSSFLLANSNHKVGIKIPEHVVNRIKTENKAIYAEISLDSDSNWNVERTHNLSGLKLNKLPDVRKDNKLAAKEYLKSKKQNGYIDKKYTEAEISGLTQKQGVSIREFQSSLSRLLSLSGSEALFDLDVKKRKDTQTPYFASLTIYSNQKNAPYIRRVACCIQNEGDQKLDAASLQSLGMSQQDFENSAISLKEADNLLKKPINQVKNKGLISLPSFGFETLSLFPEIKNKVQKWPSINKREISKSLGLANRQDHVFTVSLGKNKSHSFSFLSEVGSESSLLQKLRNKNGRCLSTCGKALITIDQNSDTVSLRDLENDKNYVLGDIYAVTGQVLTQSHKPHSQKNRSSLSEIINHHTLHRALLSNCSVPFSYSEPISLDDFDESMISPEWKGGLKDNFNAFYNSTIRKVPAYFCVDSMHENLCNEFEKAGFDLSTVIAGGVGGKKGKLFLSLLSKYNQTLFSALVRNSGIDLDSLSSLTENTRLNKKNATLTLSDLLLADVISLHQNNPIPAEHFQSIHAAKLVFEEMEPTTNLPPKEKVEELSVEFGVSKDTVENLYVSAINFKSHHNQSYKSFLSKESEILPLGDSSLHSMTALLGELRLRYPTPTTWDKQISLHLSENSLKRELNLRLGKDHPITIFHSGKTRQLDAGAWDGKFSEEIENEIKFALSVFKISKGAHNVFTRAAPSQDREELNEQHSMLLSTLNSEDTISRLNRLNETLQELGVETISYKKGSGDLVSWGADIGLAIINNENPPIKFNSSFSDVDIEKCISTLKFTLSKFGLNEKDVANRLSKVEKQALLDYKVSQFTLDFLSKKPTVVSDNNLSSKRELKKQILSSYGECHEVTYATIAKNLIKAVSLPKETQHSLLISAAGDFSKLPTDPLAKRIFKHIRELSNQVHSPLKLENGPIQSLQTSFQEGDNSPLLGAANLLTEKCNYNHINIKPKETLTDKQKNSFTKRAF